MFFSLLGGLITLLILPVLFDTSFKAIVIDLCILGLCMAIFGWTLYAMNSYPKDKVQVSYFEIQKQNNVVFFISPNNNIIQLDRFIDVKENHIKYNIMPGLWNKGIYVSPIINWQIVPKNVESQ
jgi:hypothetical protein